MVSRIAAFVIWAAVAASIVFWALRLWAQAIAVPAGHAVGMKALSPHARLLVYSDKTLEEAKGDDIRFDKNEGFDWETL